MNFVKKNLKWIITIIGAILVTTGISVYATGQYLTSQVEYNKNGQAKVSDALDDLYNKIPSGTKTITEKGNQIDVSKYQYADTTNLYTYNEVQASGKGTIWNEGTTSFSSGIININIGFNNPKVVFLYIYNTSDNALTYIFEKTSSDGVYSCKASTTNDTRSGWSGNWNSNDCSVLITINNSEWSLINSDGYLPSSGTIYWFASK